MEPIDIILIVILAIALIGIIAYLLWKKRKGESGCGCGCSSCPSAGACHRASAVKQEETPDTQSSEEGNGGV